MCALHPLYFIPTVQCVLGKRLLLCCKSTYLHRRTDLTSVYVYDHHDSGYAKSKCDHNNAGYAAALTPDTKQVLNGIEAQLLLVFCRSFIRGRLPYINNRMIWKWTLSGYQDSHRLFSLSSQSGQTHSS